MKKFLAIFLSLIMVLSLAACAGNGGSDDEDDEKSKASDEEDNDEKDKDDEKDTDAEGAEDETADKVKETTAEATEAEPVETEATTAPAEEDTTAAAPAAGTLEFYGVTVDVPKGFRLSEDTDNTKLYYSSDGNTLLGLMLMPNATYDIIMTMYSTPEGLVNAFLGKSSGRITNISEETVNGKKTIVATADITADNGETGNGFYIIVFFDDHTDILMGAKTASSSPDDVAAVEAVLDGIRF